MWVGASCIVEVEHPRLRGGESGLSASRGSPVLAHPHLPPPGLQCTGPVPSLSCEICPLCRSAVDKNFCSPPRRSCGKSSSMEGLSDEPSG